jgi:DNA-3-methyladenine glycosylase I
VPRCWWAGDDPDYVAYHDTEWGQPVTDDRALFEKLCLEGFQAGLSWLTILRKRERFREVFAGFDPQVVAAYGPADVERLLGDPGIVRNRAKIEATIGNARAMLELESLGALVWSFAPQPGPAPRTPADIPAQTPESVALSKELKRRGFRFVGPTTCYAFMQAMGLVDDHLADCPARRRTAA